MIVLYTFFRFTMDCTDVAVSLNLQGQLEELKKENFDLKGPTACQPPNPLNVHLTLFYIKYLGDSGLQVAEWSTGIIVHDENIIQGNIYAKIFLPLLAKSSSNLRLQ
jgi:hypothetical protein